MSNTNDYLADDYLTLEDLEAALEPNISNPYEITATGPWHGKKIQFRLVPHDRQQVWRTMVNRRTFAPANEGDPSQGYWIDDPDPTAEEFLLREMLYNPKSEDGYLMTMDLVERFATAQVPIYQELVMAGKAWNAWCITGDKLYPSGVTTDIYDLTGVPRPQTVKSFRTTLAETAATIGREDGVRDRADEDVSPAGDNPDVPVVAEAPATVA